MTTKIDAWWICWFADVGGRPTPALLPGTLKAPHYLNEHDQKNLIKKTVITKTYVNFTISTIIADYPFDGVSPNDSVTEPKDSSGAASAS
jgi:hypothetical protein